MSVARRRVRGAVLVCFLLVAGACGGSGSGISKGAAAQLQLRVTAIRDSAAQGDRSAAESQLQQLRVDVLQFRAADKLNDAAATRILHAADSVETDLSLLAPPSTITTLTTTTTTTTPPSRTGNDKHPGKDKGPGKDHHD